MNKRKMAWDIAQNGDVSTPKDSVVLYSISYLPSDENKRLALQYIQEHPQCMTLDDTSCGKQLIALGLMTDYKFPEDELMEIWAVASKRFILAASGNITAFVVGADKRSTFMSVELPNILKNEKIDKINGKDKFKFAAEIN